MPTTLQSRIGQCETYSVENSPELRRRMASGVPSIVSMRTTHSTSAQRLGTLDAATNEMSASLSVGIHCH